MKEEKKYSGFGELHTAKEWAKLFGMTLQGFRNGLRMGLDVEGIAEAMGVIYPPEKSAEPEPEPPREKYTRQDSVMYAGFGEVHTASRWATLLRLPRNSLWRQLKKGLTVEEVAAKRGIEYSAKYGRLK